MVLHAFLVGCSTQAGDLPHGSPPTAAVALPTFTAVVDHAGQPRSPDDLKGRPTVLWFYPAAGTPG